MKKTRFETCLPHVFKKEGGFVDHPKDPGGATNKGITLRTYRRHFGRNKTVEQLKKIAPSDVQLIYRQGYWNTANCEGMPRGVDLCLFDMAVNAGPTRAQKQLQSVLHVKQDGKNGPVTRAAAHRRDLVQTVNDFAEVRLAYYNSLKHKDAFIKGWTARVEYIHGEAIKMINSPMI
tara:strand:- start:5846 stop:6373 length:528 start_codon:yes stop_codon:yes gene_type:complete